MFGKERKRKSESSCAVEDDFDQLTPETHFSNYLQGSEDTEFHPPRHPLKGPLLSNSRLLFLALSRFNFIRPDVQRLK